MKMSECNNTVKLNRTESVTKNTGLKYEGIILKIKKKNTFKKKVIILLCCDIADISWIIVSSSEWLYHENHAPFSNKTKLSHYN